METMQVRRDIPTDVVLYHILPRLPVTSLQRFRSVCKQWYSFLKTRTFAKIHSHLVTIGDGHQLKPKLLVLSTSRSSEFKFRIIDYESSLDDASGDSRPLPFKANVERSRLLSSLHGLVCIGIVYTDDLVLWNPLTGEYKHFIHTHPKMNTFRIALGLYYSTCDDDYKVLVVLDDYSVYIYSLKSDSWRMVDSTHNYQTLSDIGRYDMWRVSTWLNGDLYFLYKDKKKYSIIKFDTKIERFTVIPTPTPPCINNSHMSMTVKRGVIHLGVKYLGAIRLWRMIRDGNWEEVGAPYRADDWMVPLHWIRDKTWLIIYNQSKCLYKVDLSTREGNCMGMNFPYTSTYIGSHTSPLKYTETFMSLDR